jgi:hypothetical protein
MSPPWALVREREFDICGRRIPYPSLTLKMVKKLATQITRMTHAQ